MCVYVGVSDGGEALCTGITPVLPVSVLVTAVLSQPLLQVVISSWFMHIPATYIHFNTLRKGLVTFVCHGKQSGTFGSEG